jgi:arginine exporter protein ArgO
MNPWQHPALNSEHWIYFALGVLAASVVWLTLVLGIGIGLWRSRSKDASGRQRSGGDQR